MNDNPNGQQGFPGQLGLSDDTDEFNAIAFVVQQSLGSTRTMTLVKVTAVTNSGGLEAVGFVDVQPLVNQIDGVGTATPHGALVNLPYFRLQGGKNAIVIDPEVDDIGLAIISDRDISAVKSTKEQSAPGSYRRFSLSDGVYLGGILNGIPEQYLQFLTTGVKLADKNGNSVALTEDGITATDRSGNVISTSSTGISLTPKSGTPVTINGNAVVTGNLQLAGSLQNQAGATYTGDLKTGGNVIAGVGGADQVGLQSHTHRYDRPTGANAPAQTVAPTAGT